MASPEIRANAAFDNTETQWRTVEDQKPQKQHSSTVNFLSSSADVVRKRDRFGVIFHRKNILTILFGLCWLAPAAVLLWLNIANYVVGAEIGRRSSRLDPTSPDIINQQKNRDLRNQNKLGALQLAAKLLDSWFVIAAGSLAYNYAIRLARKGILPVSLLSIHTEFIQLLYLKHLTENTLRVMKDKDAAVVPTGNANIGQKRQGFWKAVKENGPWSALRRNPKYTSVELRGVGSQQTACVDDDVTAGRPDRDSESGTSYGGYNQYANIEQSQLAPLRSRKNRHQLYWFILSVAGLCILSNLMNPTLAILMLPALQWMNINNQEPVEFGKLGSQVPPLFEDSAFAPVKGCYKTDLDAGLYNCTSRLYGASLDALIASASSSTWQTRGRGAVLLPAVSQEMNVSFSFNISMAPNSRSIIWVPSRQLLRNLSSDFMDFQAATSPAQVLGNQKYTLNHTYPESQKFNQSVQARLQRTGPTTGISNSCQIYRNVTTISLGVDREIRCYQFYDWKSQRPYSKCIRWGSGFPEDRPGALASFIIQDSVQNTMNISVAVYFTPKARYLSQGDHCLSQDVAQTCDWESIFANDQPENSAIANAKDRSYNQLTFEYSWNDSHGYPQMIGCDTTAYLKLATYVLDLNPVYNTLNLVEMDVTDNTVSGDISIPLHPDWILAARSVNRENGIVPGYRASATQFIESLSMWAAKDQTDLLQFVTHHVYSVAQAFSMVPYSTNNVSTNDGSVILDAYGSVQLWRYSRSAPLSVFSIIVVGLGVVVVILRTIYYLEPSKTSTELIVDALCHPAIHPDSLISEKSGAPLRVSYTRKPERPSMRHRRKSSAFEFHHPNRSSATEV